MGACKSCKAEVEWVKTSKGNTIPLDARPCADGNIVLRHGEAHVLGKEALAALPADTPRFKAHFVTCPNADEHRKEPRRG